MNIYQDLEDSLYNVVSGLFPTWTIIFALQNGPEPTTPYLVIDVKRMDAQGREYQSSLVDVDIESNISQIVTLQDYQVKVRFEFVGKYDNNTTLAEMSHQLDMSLRTQIGYDLQKINKLSLFSKSEIERFKLKRETDTFMYYQLDVVFAYTMKVTQEFDYIDVVGLTGVYRDAGREPDHTITNVIDIDPS